MNGQNFQNWWNVPPSAELSQALSGLLRDLFLLAPAELLARLANTEGPAENVYKVRKEHNPLIGICYHPSLMEGASSLTGTPPFVFRDKWIEFENARRKEYDENETNRSASDYRLYRRPFRTRYELYTEPAYALELVSRLVYPGDKETSVYFRTEELDGDVGWNWPLRIGFLPNNESRWLFEELKTYVRDIKEWVGSLVHLVQLDSETDNCDLLLIPTSIQEACELVSNLGIRISADCVVAIGPTNNYPWELQSTIEVFRDKLSTAGVGIAPFDPLLRKEWFTTLIRELSHNEPIDVALFSAGSNSGSQPPFLAASRKLIEFSKLAESIKSIGEELLKASPSAPPIPIEPDDAEVFGIEPRDYHPKEIGEIFRSDTDKFMFDQERKSGIRSASVSRSAKRSMRESEKAEEVVEQRKIQAAVYDLSSDEKAKLQNALRAGAQHKTVVRVGTREAGWIQNSEEFDPGELSDKKTYKLTVIFMEPQLFEEPRVSSIKLPPEGNSTECEFTFQVPEDVEKIEARISIVYKNRVLQTALLKADVVADPADTAGEHQIELVREAIRADLSGLKDRRNFDGTFILNHDTTGAPGVTAIKDKYVSFASLGQLDTFVKQVDEFMTRVADYPADYAGKLDTPATVTLLCDLAKHGQILYEALAEYPRGNMPEIFSELSPTGPKIPQRIQIISAKSETRLPMEFLYDRTAPEDSNGKLCPKAVEALEHDACFSDCDGIKEPEKHVCPMGFWGLSKIIERHTYKTDYTETTVDGSFRFQSEPVEGRKHLDIFRGVLFGASKKADKIEVRSADGNTVTVEAGGLKKVLSTLDTITNSKYQHVASWKDWRDKINSAPAPTALLLLTHTEKKGSIPALEIEQGVLVEMQSIKKEYVYSRKEPYPPVVFLIGCETGAADIEFMNFVAQFRRGGAAIIVSTGAPIRGRHAVPVTVELLDQLKKYSDQPAMSFGQVMRVVKQKMVAGGFPMVLTLMTYGDADWQIGTAKQ